MKKSEKTIIAEFLKIKGNNVWRVKVSGSNDKKKCGYCKNALSAIRLCYVFKSRFDLPINSQSMDLLLYVNELTKTTAV